MLATICVFVKQCFFQNFWQLLLQKLLIVLQDPVEAVLSTVLRERSVKIKVVEKLLKLPLTVLYYDVTSLCFLGTSSEHPTTQSLEIGL